MSRHSDAFPSTTTSTPGFVFVSLAIVRTCVNNDFRFSSYLAFRSLLFLPFWYFGAFLEQVPGLRSK
jgi:hypothetical protein